MSIRFLLPVDSAKGMIIFTCGFFALITFPQKDADAIWKCNRLVGFDFPNIFIHEAWLVVKGPWGPRGPWALGPLR